MEIIIRMEEKENPTVGAVLREMVNDYWVKTYLPQIIQTAESGKTQMAVLKAVHEDTAKLIKESFSKLGIKVIPREIYNTKYGWHYKEILFSWN